MGGALPGIIIMVIGGLLAAVGLGALALGALDLARAGASTHWPHTAGHIVKSQVGATSASGSGFGLDGRYHSHSVSTDSVDIRYTYVVEGRPRTGERLTYDSAPFERSECERIVAQYPVGKGVEVYYDPENPDISLLRPGVRDGAWVRLAWTGAILPGLGGAIFLAGWLSRRAPGLRKA